MAKSANTILEFLNRVTGISAFGFGLQWSPKSDQNSMVEATNPKYKSKASKSTNGESEIKPPMDRRTQVEPYFWLAQALIGWSISNMELAYQQFEVQAKALSLGIAREADDPNEFLAQNLDEIDTRIHAKHGETARNIFRLGSLISLLPLFFNEVSQLRNLKAAAEKMVLQYFGIEGLTTVTSFLSELPCEIKEFVKKVEHFKVAFQSVISNEPIS